MRGISHWLKTRFQTFDLLAEYFTAAMQGAVDVLWGVALPFLAWMVYSLFKTPAPWINWLAILSALFLAGYYVWRADHVRLIPKLAVRDSRLLNTPITLNGSVYDQRTFVQLVPTCLTAAPVYECVAYLQNVQRLGGNGWEDTTLDKNLILNWATEHHPQAEQPLNVFFIQHRTNQIIPCLPPGADIPWAKFDDVFKREPSGAAFRFYIQITYSNRVGGHFESVVKPLRACLEVQFANDPFEPFLELKEL
jgi:hypothetical protein